MEKNSTFIFLYDNIESYEDLIDADEIFDIDEDISNILENIGLLNQTPRKEITDNIIEYSKSIKF